MRWHGFSIDRSNQKPYSSRAKRQFIFAVYLAIYRVVAQGLAHLVRDQGVGGSNPLCPIFLCLRDLHEAFVLDGRVRVGVEGRSMTHEGGLGRTTAHQDASELLYLPSAFCFSKSSMASWNISSIWVVHASREYFFADWAYSCSICFL